MCIKHFPPFLNHYNSVKKSEKLYFSQELKKKEKKTIYIIECLSSRQVTEQIKLEPFFQVTDLLFAGEKCQIYTKS